MKELWDPAKHATVFEVADEMLQEKAKGKKQITTFDCDHVIEKNG